MKKIFLFAALLALVAFAAQSQTVTKTLNLKSDYIYQYTGTSSDVLEDSLEVITKVFYVDAAKKYSAYIVIDVDSIAGAKVWNTYQLYGSSDGTQLFSLGTGSSVTWYGSSSDTTIALSTGYSTYNLSQTTVSYLRGTSDSTGDYKDTTTTTLTETVRYDVKCSYPYLVLRCLNVRPGDSEIQKIVVAIKEEE